jgi:2-keto-4-pentenoate hydratase
MAENARLQAMAQWMWQARQRRLPYRNLPDELRPAKIATMTKVMQKLMGINHPCGGAIFSRTIHRSPAKLRAADFVNLRIESEIALKLGADLPASGAPWTRERVAPAVAAALPAFELIEDRNADYATTDASSLIVENCWNGGIVIGAPHRVLLDKLVGITGRLKVAGKLAGEGAAEDPCATLAWLANHVAERGRDLKADMIVITGSLIATVSIAPGQRAVFAVDGLGEVTMDVV